MLLLDPLEAEKGSGETDFRPLTLPLSPIEANAEEQVVAGAVSSLPRAADNRE